LTHMVLTYHISTQLLELRVLWLLYR
jgi:hypothetical protein